MAKKKLKFKFDVPTKVQAFLIGAMIFLIFWIDVIQNKLIDKGLDYQVHVSSTFTLSAVSMFWILAFAYILVIFALVSRTTWSKEHHYLDFFVGAVIMYGFIFIISGAVTGFIMPDFSVPLQFFANLTQIGTYHIALATQILGSFYFLFTE